MTYATGTILENKEIHEPGKSRPIIHVTGQNMSLDDAIEYVQKLYKNPKGSEHDRRIHDEIINNSIAGDPSAKLNLIMRIKSTLKEHKINVPDMDLLTVSREIYNSSYGLDVIQPLWDNPHIDEIMVNRFNNVWVVERGVSKQTSVAFKDDERVAVILNRMVLHAGQNFSKDCPRLRVMRKDKSRLTATRPPFSRYYNFTLRKLDNFDLTESNYLKSGTLSPALLAYIKCLIRGRVTTIFSGPTNSGKSTDLMFFLQYLPDNCRIVVLDKTGELFLQDRYPRRNIVELQEVEKVGLTLKEGFDTILSFTPNIIVVPEVRSTEGEEMLKACTRGHDGSLTTVHGNSPEEVIDVFPSIIMEDGKPRDPELLRSMIARAFNIIIQKSWNPETGQRRIEKITEIYVERDKVKFNELIVWMPDNQNWYMKNLPTKRIYDRMKFYQVPEQILKDAQMIP